LALLFFALADVDDVVSLFEMLDTTAVYFKLSGVLFHHDAHEEWRRDNVFYDSPLNCFFKEFAERIDGTMVATLDGFPRSITMRYLIQSKYFFGLVRKKYEIIYGQLQRYIQKVQMLVPEANREEVQTYVLQDAWFSPDFEFFMIIDEGLTLEDIQDSI